MAGIKVNETVAGKKCLFTRPFGNGAEEEGILKLIVSEYGKTIGFQAIDIDGYEIAGSGDFLKKIF